MNDQFRIELLNILEDLALKYHLRGSYKEDTANHVKLIEWVAQSRLFEDLEDAVKTMLGGEYLPAPQPTPPDEPQRRQSVDEYLMEL